MVFGCEMNWPKSEEFLKYSVVGNVSVTIFDIQRRPYYDRCLVLQKP